MNRIKVVNDPSELVSTFRAVDTELKREIFKEVSAGWKTAQEIEDKIKAAAGLTGKADQNEKPEAAQAAEA